MHLSYILCIQLKTQTMKKAPGGDANTARWLVVRQIHKQTNTHTDRSDYNTLRRSFASAQCNKLCGRPPQYAPAPCKLTSDLLTLKVVSETRVTWATSVPILVFLGTIAGNDHIDRQTASNTRCCPASVGPTVSTRLLFIAEHNKRTISRRNYHSRPQTIDSRRHTHSTVKLWTLYVFSMFYVSY